MKIAVIGQGIAGMSAAWLLSQRHDVTVYDAAPRFGGHSHTVDAPSADGPIPVDMGFIVYNEANYPNLAALFRHLGVPTAYTDMSFGVSLDDGDLEYASTDLSTLFAQPRNLLRPRFWSMLRDVVRFSRQAPAAACALDARMTSLGDYLGEAGYGRPFQDDHILPQAAAIWSASIEAVRELPAASFIRFFENHGLLKILDKPLWRTVVGGSRSYVERLTATLRLGARLGVAATRIERTPAGVMVADEAGRTERFDQVVVACHADQGLAMLAQPTAAEREIIGAFTYTPNVAVLHADASFMPKRRKAWSSWNYLGRSGAGAGRELCVTYWMNLLQDLPRKTPLFVTLNPIRAPDPAKVIRTEHYDHPLFDAAALRAQKRLWSVQGEGGVWWCGAYCGAGFHEDGLQAGLAVAEALGGVRRPWIVPNESGRIFLGDPAPAPALEAVA
ncbi:MAG TPA: FAD-dependent oxidoreductase [Caulobacteraceae bacterium]|nr:FAD-dependent oxidoreductase [Caulobacteraceae bacterium]